MSDRRRLLRAVLRRDLPTFIAKCFATLEPGTPYRNNWHIRHIAHNLVRVSDGDVKRLIVNIPPRHMKSIAVTIAYTAWALGRNPALKIICVSYAHELARQHAQHFRTIIESPWYKEVFPEFRVPRGGNRDIETVTTRHGRRYASSVDGTVLGRGADLIIVDDPIKAQDALSAAERRRVNEFYDNTLYTRLNDKTRGAIIIVMQRLHTEDLVGHVLAKEDWEKVVIPAIETEARDYQIGPASVDVHRREAGELIDPTREPADVIHQIRRNLGSMNFSAQYQQDPVPAEGNVIKREWIRYYDTPPSNPDLIMVSWDTASTIGLASDYSVGSIWALYAGDIFLLNVIRGQYEVPDLRRRILEIHGRHGAHATLIERTDIGRAVAQDLRRSSGLRAILPQPKFDKRARLEAQAAKFEAGQVLLPREAPWLAEYLNELLAFPNGKHDDQVDSTSQALNWLSAKLAAGVPPVRPNPTRPLGTPRISRLSQQQAVTDEPWNAQEDGNNAME